MRDPEHQKKVSGEQLVEKSSTVCGAGNVPTVICFLGEIYILKVGCQWLQYIEQFDSLAGYWNYFEIASTLLCLKTRQPPNPTEDHRCAP